MNQASEIIVNLPNCEYPILFRPDFANLGEILHVSDMRRKIFLVTDENIPKAYIRAICADFICILPPGEANKNLAALERVYGEMADARLGRRDLVIGLGGGVVGDIAAFAAATYMRGISYAAIPTTTMAMADSSIGGKCGVDFRGAKNLIGTFYQPDFVYMPLNTLATLSDADYFSGLAEVVKHAIIRDRDFFQFLQKNRAAIIARDILTLANIFAKSCQIKAGIVAEDIRDFGIRRLLNFGHTFGHAIEQASDFALPHGYCVALGMVCAINYAPNFPADQKIQIMELLQSLNLPTKINLPISANDIFAQMQRDKKAENGAITLIIASQIGRADIISGDPAQIQKAITAIF